MTPERTAYHRLMLLAGFCGEYERELDEGMISEEVFETGFESVFLHGERLDVWALQREYNQKRKGRLFWWK